MRTPLLFSVAFVLASAEPCRAQCILANPSFELPGAGQRFAGWFGFGNVGATDRLTSHGSTAAAVFGPFTGDWDMSGYLQQMDAAAGQRWAVRGRAGHRSSDPLAGQNRAFAIVEWHDADGALLAYEAHPVVEATTEQDWLFPFAFESAPAPAATRSVRVILGLLQGPDQARGSAVFDQAEFELLPAPDQWGDFGPRTIRFSNATWRVKGPGYYGPGPNFFSDSPDLVWVDDDQRLHLKIARISGRWSCAEVAIEDALGYGEYRFKTTGRVDQLDINAVFGLFTWEYRRCYEGIDWWNVANEFDLEFSRWGDGANEPAQFICQPYQRAGNASRFDIPLDATDTTATHTYLWMPDRVECRSWLGHDAEPTPETLVHEWNYAGPDIPRPERPRVHLNLWLINGNPPASGQSQEVIIDRFEFTPACARDLNGDGLVDVDDLHEAHQTPLDLNLDGVRDAGDARSLERFLRSGENEDMRAGRRR